MEFRCPPSTNRSFPPTRPLRRILPDHPSVEWIDPSARVSLVERTISSSWAGHLVNDLDEPGVIRVAAVGRLGVGQVPRPDLVIQEGDVLYLTVAGDALATLDAKLATRPKGGH